MEQEAVYVGIDVAKAHLDVAVRPIGQRWTISNDEPGIRELVSRLRALEPAMVVLEASGGLELPSVVALVAASLPVAIVNPRQTRDFAKATGTLAKTDALDAGRTGPLRRRRSPSRASSEGRRDPGSQLSGCPQAPSDSHLGVGEEPAWERHQRRPVPHRGPHRLA